MLLKSVEEVDVHHLLCFEERVGEHVGDAVDIWVDAGLHNLLFEVAAFEAYQAGRQWKSARGIAVDVAAAGHYKVAERHHGAAYDIVEHLSALRHVAVLKGYVFEPYGIGHIGGYAQFLAYAVDEMEAAVGVIYCQWDSGKAASRAEVDERCAVGNGAEISGYGKRVKHVAGVEIVDIGTRNNIDFGVPVIVELLQEGVLYALIVGQLRKCVVYYLNTVFCLFHI